MCGSSGGVVESPETTKQLFSYPTELRIARQFTPKLAKALENAGRRTALDQALHGTDGQQHYIRTAAKRKRHTVPGHTFGRFDRHVHAGIVRIRVLL